MKYHQLFNVRLVYLGSSSGPGGSTDTALELYADQLVARCLMLLKAPPAMKDEALENTRRKLWQAAAKLAAASTQSVDPEAPQSPKSLLSAVSKVSSMASTQKWLQDAIKFRADVAKQAKDKKAPTLSDMILRFAQRGPPSEMLEKMIADREALAKCRVEGYRQFAEMLTDPANKADKIRILAVMFDALHTGSDVHYMAKLQGVNAATTAEVERAWTDVVNQIVLDCRKALASTDSAGSIGKHSLCVSVLGLALVIQDYRLTDVLMIRDCGLIGLLDTVTKSSHLLLRELAFKCVEIMVYRCCLQDFVKPPASPRSPAIAAAIADVGEVNLLSRSTEAADALLPGLMHILHSELELITEGNISEPLTPVSETDLMGKSASWLLKQVVTCGPVEPGFVAQHRHIPTSHSLGLWLWRPAGKGTAETTRINFMYFSLIHIFSFRFISMDFNNYYQLMHYSRNVCYSSIMIICTIT